MSKRFSRLIALTLCAIFCLSTFVLAEDANLNPSGTFPIVKEPIQLTVARNQDPTILDMDTNFQTKWVEEKTGIDIVWELYPAAEAAQKMNIQIASGAKLPDIISAFTTTADPKLDLNVYGMSGALVPLNDYLDQAVNFNARCAELGLDREWVLNLCRATDGNIYGLPYLFANPPDTISWRSWINADWLTKLGLEYPTTSDELLTVLRAFRDNDPNGNGQKDEVPMVSANEGWNTNVFRPIMNMFIYYDSGDNYYLLQDGVLDVSYDKAEYREALRFARAMYDEGLITSQSFTQDYAAYQAMCSQDPQIVGIGVSGSASPFGTNRPSYEGVPALKGPAGAQFATGSFTLPGISAGISSDCANFDAAFRLLDAFYTDDLYMHINRWGEPEVDWTYPSEGEVSAFDGVKPGVKTLKDIWGKEQNSTWRNGFIPTIAPADGSLYSPVWNGDTTTGESKNARAIAKLQDFIPAERVATILYTDEENLQWAETRAVIKAYIKEAQAQFITGALDIEKDWDAYVAQLDTLGYKDMLAADQAALNRTIGK